MAKTGSLALFVALTLAGTAVAEELEFTMNTEVTKVGEDDPFNVVISIANAPDNAKLELPQSADFQTLGRSESTQMSINAGFGSGSNIRKVRLYTLTLKPRKLGTIVIPRAVLRWPGGSSETKELRVQVVKGSIAPQRARNDPRSLFDLFGFPEAPAELDEETAAPSGEEAVLRSTFDKNEVYVGEQVTYTTALYVQGDIASVDGLKLPNFNGFSSTTLRAPTNLTPERGTYQGRPYRVFTLQSKALFPLRPGTIKLDPSEVEFTTFGFWGGKRIKRSSSPITLKVKPLPPGGNSELVGQWTMTRELSATTLVLGEPLTVKLRIDGRGAVGNIPAMKLPELKGVKVYEAASKDTTTPQGSYLSATRTIEYTLIPQTTGTIELPSQRLSYFDPASGRWEATSVPAAQLQVIPSNRSADSAAPGTTPEPIAKNQLSASNPRPLRYTMSPRPAPPSPVRQNWFWGATALPLILGLIGFGYTAVRRRGPAGSSPKERLKKLEAASAGLPPQAFYAELEALLLQYLEGVTGTALGSHTRADLNAAVAKVFSEPAQRNIARLLDACETTRFAPGMGEALPRAEALRLALELLGGKR